MKEVSPGVRETSVRARVYSCRKGCYKFRASAPEHGKTVPQHEPRGHSTIDPDLFRHLKDQPGAAFAANRAHGQSLDRRASDVQRFKIHDFVVMPDHFHLLINPGWGDDH